MTERRPWSPEEDRLLRVVFETSHIRKWSHIARRLQEEYGIRGRNGKQCRERYLTTIDCSLPRDEWSYDQEQKMMELHNQIGNKWAVIGIQIGERSDNSVKNHFYSRLRKGLRKVNLAIKSGARKEIKQFKPNVLYRIVEVAQESFKTQPTFQKIFSTFSNQLKNQLFDFAYDDEVEMNNFEEERGYGDDEQAVTLIDKLIEFGSNYKRKAKKQRRPSGNGQNLLTPDRYLPKITNQNDENEHSVFIAPSSDTSNYDEHNSDIVSVPQKACRPRRCSEESTTFLINQRIRTRAFSQSSQEPIQPIQEDPSKTGIQADQLQNALDGMHILEVEAILPTNPLLIKRESSRYFRSDLMDQQFHFFDDSHMELRILPEVDFTFRRDSQFDENIFI